MQTRELARHIFEITVVGFYFSSFTIMMIIIIMMINIRVHTCTNLYIHTFLLSNKCCWNKRNPSVPCSSLPDTDLKAWMEAPGMMMPNNIGINKK